MVFRHRNTNSPGAILLVLTAGLLVAAQQVAATTLSEADRLYREGQFAEAAEAYLDSGDGVAATVGASRSYAMVGEYRLALKVCRDALQNPTDSPLIATQLAEVLFATGRSDEALRLLEPVASSPEAPVRALVKYGEILRFRGNREDADLYLSAAISDYSARNDLGSEELALIARAYWLTGNYQRANDLFRQATEMDSHNLEAQVWWGDLFAEKFNDAEAIRSYRTVLEQNPNHVAAAVGYARASGESRVLEQALFTNPRSSEAFTAYAALALEKNKFDRAESYLDAALPNNPESLEIIEMLAGIAHLKGDTQAYDRWRQRAESIRPNNGAFYTTIARMYAQDYRFAEAVEFARKATEVQPDHWPAYTALGTNLGRLGKQEESRKHLEFAFDKDPYNVRTSNMLKVFDTLDDYATLSSEHFNVRMSGKDALVLWPYLEPLLEEAWDTMVGKYGFTPESPVFIEVFENREDFAVRSVGLPDVGPLVGICFGNLITLISPATLTANWQEIVWHEFVHVISLQMTRNRIPRWLSEGVSVYEEFQGRPEWGEHRHLDTVRAMEEGRFLPVEEIDDAFLNARSSEDLNLAYLQSYLVVEYIVSEHGFGGLREFIAAHGSHEATAAIIADVFDRNTAQFNRGFSAWLQNRVDEADVYVHTEDDFDQGAVHGHGIRNNTSATMAEVYSHHSIKTHMLGRIKKEPRDFHAHLQLGIVLFKENNYDEAERHLQSAKALLPRYSGYPSPSLILSQLYKARGQDENYWREMQHLAKYHQHDFAIPFQLAEKALEEGAYDRAEYYLQRAMAVDPYRLPAHQRYAELADKTGNNAARIREYEILVELDNTDPVQAHTQLAEAYLQGGKIPAAKHYSLLALEIAPTYRPAQEVLLEALDQ